MSLLPADAYKRPVTNLGYSRRSIVLFNEPELVRQILTDPDGIFPKNDLMVGALEPLIGRSIFVTDGEQWQRQRAMIEPAFGHMRINLAFEAMKAAVDDYEPRLDRHARDGEVFSIDRAMSELTADIICRTVFSVSLDGAMAQDMFEDFAVFERAVAQVEIGKLILTPAFSEIRQPREVLAACQRIRNHLGKMVDTHLEGDRSRFNDIASSVIAARDEQTGDPLTREELIDQLGVFFLAGHETTASVLTWVFYILAQQPDVLQKIRQEISHVCGEDVIELEHTKRMPLLRNLFRETLRLYPPVTFTPRVAQEAVRIGPKRLKRGAMVMISPWTLHRHHAYWQRPESFELDRFSPVLEGELVKGAYIPFGLGRHTCIGSAFAMAEAALIIARLVRRYNFQVVSKTVRPAARLTTRPAEQIMASVHLAP